MPKYLVNLQVTGTLDDEGLQIESIEEMAPKPLWKRALLWLWELSWQIKLFILVVLGIAGYGLHCSWVAGSFSAGLMCLSPIYERIEEIVTGLITG
jgi:hypothetical protein